jgi:hypothetical protein
MLKLFLLIFSIGYFTAHGQERNGESFQKDYQIHITKTKEPIKIDGELNEPIWQNAQMVTSFWEK